MNFHSSSEPKMKSAIPQPITKKTAAAASGSSSHRSQKSPDLVPTQATASNPLAAVMNKKKPVKKNTTSESVESWADVKSESVSQKRKPFTHTDSLRRKEDIERQLQEAEGQLGQMTGLLEKREKLLEETKKAADGRIEELEERLMGQEGIMAEHGIDPVTGEKVPQSNEDKKKVNESKKITKKTVQAMRDKLREMNLQTETFLADIENTMQYLSSLEETSERAGPFSTETQQMIDRISGNEDAIKKVLDENTPPEKKSDKSKEDYDEDGDDHEDELDDGDNGKFFITSEQDEQSKSKCEDTG